MELTKLTLKQKALGVFVLVCVTFLATFIYHKATGSKETLVNENCRKGISMLVAAAYFKTPKHADCMVNTVVSDLNTLNVVCEASDAKIDVNFKEALSSVSEKKGFSEMTKYLNSVNEKCLEVMQQPLSNGCSEDLLLAIKKTFAMNEAINILRVWHPESVVKRILDRENVNIKSLNDVASRIIGLKCSDTIKENLDNIYTDRERIVKEIILAKSAQYDETSRNAFFNHVDEDVDKTIYCCKSGYRNEKEQKNFCDIIKDFRTTYMQAFPRDKKYCDDI